MDFFKECKECKPPKRKPGCHSTCTCYLENKKKYDECANADKMRRDLNAYIKKYPN